MTGFKMIEKRNNNKQYTVGVVETKFHSFAEPGNELKLESGDSLGPITLAYETFKQG
jgi:3-hydroxymyristoyl/3-hydroxydecanoyl-(acyl carrier protein) dehydratase